jgi:ATP phosphoribosyltransferase
LKTDSTLRIALQKSGRLTEESIGLLKQAGMKFDSYKGHMIVPVQNFDIELLLIRDDDIPEYVQDGVCDIGFVGANVTAEKNADVTVIRNLGFGKCRLSVAVPKEGPYKSARDLDGKRIATSYPSLTRRYFEGLGMQVTTVTISGAVEIAPRLGVSDAVCDLVSTGGTLKANGLVETDIIFESESQLIQTNKPISAAKQELIDKFLLRIGGCQLAQRSRYILMNAPKASLPEILSTISALKSPTILPLADENMVAIHSVVPIKEFWSITEKLKDAGATGIVILPIENIIM